MTRQAKLSVIARILMGYETGNCIAETAYKILDSIEGNMKKPKGKKKGC